jgi:F-type H+-transporting ATPase subunit a
MSDSFNLEEYIFHHVLDSKEWDLPFLSPIILPGFLSVHAVMLFLCATLLIILFVFIYDKKSRVPTGITNLLEAFVVFIRDDIAIKNLGEDDGRKMTPLFCTFFFFILGLNLLGMIPAFSAATANINVTGALAAIILGFLIIGVIAKNGVYGFFKALTPSGVPWPILILLLPIEFAGIFIKAFALMIRLFANLLAGHIVILSMLGLVVLIGYVALPVLVLVLFINVIELFVAFLQAYIFTFLSATFIGLMYHPEH